MLYTLAVKLLLLINLFGIAHANLITNIDSQFVQDIERNSYTNEISEKLNKFGYTFIVGFGGVGKTHLAQAFSSKAMKSHYYMVWWIDCKKDINQQLQQLIKRINANYENAAIPENATNERVMLENIKQFIELKKLKILLILDSLDEPKAINRLFLANMYLNLLITSRVDSGKEATIKLENFSRVQSINYLKKLLTVPSDNDLDRLAEALKDYPIALAQSAIYLHHNKALSVDEYIKLYKQDLKTLWQKEENILSENEARAISVKATLNLSLSQLEQKKKLSKKLLILFSLINNQSISLDFLKEVIQVLGEDKEEVVQATSDLINHFYIEVSHNKLNGKTSFFMHEIKQQMLLAVFAQSEMPTIRDVIKALHTVILDKFQKNKNRIILFSEESPEYIDHADSYFEKKQSINLPLLTEELSVSIFMLDYLLYVKRNHQKALELIDSISPFIDGLNDLNLKARFYSSAGDVLSLHRAGAEHTNLVFQKMITSLKEKENLDPYEVVRLNNSVGQNYLLKADPKKAKEYIFKSLEIITPLQEPLIKIPTYYFASWACIDLSEYNEALNLLNKAIDLFDLVPDTAIKFYTYNNKALTLLALEKYQEAQRLCDLSIKNCRQYFGSYESDTLAEAIAYRAKSHLYCQNFEKAVEDATESIRIYNSFYKGDNKVIDQMHPWVIKGDSHLIRNELDEAHTAYVKAILILNIFDNSRTSPRFKNTYKKVLFTSSALKKRNTFESYKTAFKELFGEGFEGQYSLYHLTTTPAELIFVN